MSENKLPKNDRKNRFYSVKELSAAFKVHPDTMRRELKRVPKLRLKKYQQLLSPKDALLIFSHLGDPFAE